MKAKTAYYLIHKPLRRLWGAEPGPAVIIAPDRKEYSFPAGYGDYDRFPTQEGCALIVSWLQAQSVLPDTLTLTGALDAAKRAASKEE